MKSFLHETSKKKSKQRAIAVGVCKKGEPGSDGAAPLEELVSLCKTAGAQVVGRLTQVLERYNAATLIGSGKVDELAELTRDRNADIVVFDTVLAPSQQVNLEKRLGMQVIDRPGVILDIFAIHAKTREARAQVELAQMQYMLPRLAGGWSHLERQEGAIGTRGPGETQLETDRRLVRKRITDLKKKLENIEGERHLQRQGRQELFNVCLVGYTNAGKSTVFNRLTGESVTAENYLFATLDSTTRKVKLSAKNQILLSDTVGFIRRLPVTLVASFKSTLLEASEADLLLHVIDIADDYFEERITTVNDILKEIGCEGIPGIPIFNKIDLRNDPDLYRTLIQKYPGARFISAASGEGLSRLKADLEELVENSRVTIQADIAPSEGRVYGILSAIGQVLSSRADDGVINLTVRLPQSRLGRLKNEGVKYKVLENANGFKK